MHVIYKGSRDGLKPQNFKEKVFNAGPTLIILRDIKDVLFGGFTSKNWTGEESHEDDPDAFVFNMQDKYTPFDNTRAIYTHSNGFEFGNGVLSVAAGDDEVLNHENKGKCIVGQESFYNI